MRVFLFLLSFLISTFGFSQTDFNYEVRLVPVELNSFVGLHSFTAGHIGSKWVLIGGRKDGVHARQPFNAFPNTKNNDSIFVIDIETKQIWAKSLNTLATGIKEQLQSTNINFYQDHEKLLLLGGYAYSNTAADHITFPYLTIINLPSLIQHIMQDESIQSDFLQFNDERFANTGGYLNKLGDEYVLVGGHRFDGRYNPMNNPTFTQKYLDGMEIFKISETNQIQFIEKITDEIHLHRRDYNLLTQYNANEKYLLLSSGVFQIYDDLPFLYPVEIHRNSVIPLTQFNQYLSNYHSAKTNIYDSINNTNFSILYGGISQYYYEGNQLINDQTVPFVKTISLLVNKENQFQEYKFQTEMPGLKGAGAYFFPKQEYNLMDGEVLRFGDLTKDTNHIGYLIGGIESQSKSAFTDNQTHLTQADKKIYEVHLIKTTSNQLTEVKVNNKFQIKIYPNPSDKEITLEFELDKKSEVYFFLTDFNGKIVDEGFLEKTKKGKNIEKLSFPSNLTSGQYQITFVKDSLFFYSSKILFK